MTVVDAHDAAACQREIAGLLDEFAAGAMQESLLAARQVDLARQLLARQGQICGSVPSVLALHAGVSTIEAKRICRLARRLPDLPGINTAFRAGRLSPETADLLAKVATPANEAVLLETAAGATGNQLRTIVRRYRRIRAGDQPPIERDEAVTYGPTESMWTLRAELSPVHGAEIDAALRAAREDLKASRVRVEEPDGLRHSERDTLTTTEVLLHLARTYLETKVTAGGVLPERFQAIIHINAHTTPTPTTAPAGEDLDAMRARSVSAAEHPPTKPEKWSAPTRQETTDTSTGTAGTFREKCGPGPGPDNPSHPDHPDRPDRKPEKLTDAARTALTDTTRRHFSVTDPDDLAHLHTIGALDAPDLATTLCDATLALVATIDDTPSPHPHPDATPPPPNNERYEPTTPPASSPAADAPATSTPTTSSPTPTAPPTGPTSPCSATTTTASSTNPAGTPPSATTTPSTSGDPTAPSSTTAPSAHPQRRPSA